jgi:hypothetical protein
MAKEYDPGNPKVVEFKITKVRFGKDRGFRVACKRDGWSETSDTEQGAALEFDKHRRTRHPHHQVKRVW